MGINLSTKEYQSRRANYPAPWSSETWYPGETCVFLPQYEYRFRPKAPFVPGYYRATTEMGNNPCIWFDTELVLGAYAADEGLKASDFHFVTVRED
jgi:hypothetical protein